MCRESIKVTDGDGLGERPVFGGLDAMLRESRRTGEPVMFQWTWRPSPIAEDGQVWIDHAALQAIADAMPDLSGAI